MSFFRRFLWIFVSPNRVFDDIRDSKANWWQPWVMVSALTLVATALMIPMQRVLLEMNPKFSGAQVEKQMAMVSVSQMVMAPVMVLFVTLIVCGLTYVIVTVMSREATFKKYFTLILFTSVVSALGYLATALLLRARGMDTITSPEDLHASLSLRVLAPEGSAVLKGLLGSIEFFSIWGLVLIAAGLRRTFGMRLGQALACVIPLWLLYAVFTVLGEMFANFGQ
ncbi:MAG TPA: YIP1 family protein [Candidatus Krumholzibacteria bacterium]|nr:YIP1 family protein [Candidatus Krumholzibacteria bacterium]